MRIRHRPGRENKFADALSRCPHSPAPSYGIAERETQVARVNASTIADLLNDDPSPDVDQVSICAEQRKDPWICGIIAFLQEKELPNDEIQARMVAAQSFQFDMVNGVLYFIDIKHGGNGRVVVPEHLRQQLLHESHSGPSGGHYSGRQTFNRLGSLWWW